MTRFTGLMALAALAVAVALGNDAQAAGIRDEARLFHPDVVRKAQAQLDQVEHRTGIPIVIETIDALPGIGKDASKTERETEINREAEKRDREIHDEGLYILISKRDRVISNVLIRQRYAALLPTAKRRTIREAFVAEFRKDQNYDGGLTAGVRAIEESLPATKAVVPLNRNLARRGGAAQSSMMGTFFLIILGILGVLLVVRLLGSLMGRGAGAGYQPMQGGMGPGGMGPGGMGAGGPGNYGGGGGYGARPGGGFFSGMLGGLGGALAGNWLYDQFSGRHGQTNTSEAYTPDVANPDAGGDAIVGGDDDGGQGESWGDSGTPDAGGGWGDSGGGDWGGGGGDWGGDGGGGGDW